VVMICPARAPGAEQARQTLGAEHVLTLGADEVDLGSLPGVLSERGFDHVLCEGGPSLARDLLAAGVVDELCATTVPRLIAGDHLRLAHGDALDVPLDLVGLLEEDGTLLARWLVRR
jgi:riboflavin biosynthesis pyrimidine reductase